MVAVPFYMDSENIMVDDAANTATFTLFQKVDWDHMPAGNRGQIALIPSVTLTVPIRKNLVIPNQVFVETVAPTTVGGPLTYVRWELVNGSWVSKGPCNRDGSQPVV
jgi:hypothetical protein